MEKKCCGFTVQRKRWEVELHRLKSCCLRYSNPNPCDVGISSNYEQSCGLVSFFTGDTFVNITFTIHLRNKLVV